MIFLKLAEAIANMAISKIAMAAMSGIEKFLMGSVAEKVVHNSKQPVLVVR